MKAPPTDRLWVGFYKLPDLELDISPLVHSTSVKWSVVTSLIERQMQEALVEYVVLPNMDDILLPPAIVGDGVLTPNPYLKRRGMPETLLDHLISAQKLQGGQGVAGMRRCKSMSDLLTQEHREFEVEERVIRPLSIISLIPSPIAERLFENPALLDDAAANAIVEDTQATHAFVGHQLERAQTMREAAQVRMGKIQATSKEFYRSIQRSISGARERYFKRDEEAGSVLSASSSMKSSLDDVKSPSGQRQ